MIVQIIGLLGIPVIEENIWGDGQTSHHSGFPTVCLVVLRNPPKAPIIFIPPAIPKTGLLWVPRAISIFGF